jgi:hypothetical protein
MNANRRLEEFIFKLNQKQNKTGQFDKTNKLNINSNLIDLQMSKGNLDTNNCKKSSCRINDK